MQLVHERQSQGSNSFAHSTGAGGKSASGFKKRSVSFEVVSLESASSSLPFVESSCWHSSRGSGQGVVVSIAGVACECKVARNCSLRLRNFYSPSLVGCH